MTSLLRLANLKVAAYGEAMFNRLKYGFRNILDRSEYRRTVRLRNILNNLTDAGVGGYTKAEVEEIIRKKLMQ